MVAMAHFGDAIRRLRQAKYLTIRQMADISGLSTGTIVEAEKSAAPKGHQSTYRLLAQALGMTTAELDRQWRGRKIPSHPNLPGIPVINRAPAGKIVNYEEHSMSGDFGMGTAYLDRGSITDPNAFAVVIVGDSMVPQLQDGDRAIFVPVDPEGLTHNGGKKIPHGHTVFVRFAPDSNDGGCTVGMLSRLSDGRIEVRKLNAAKYGPKIFRTEQIQSIAALVEIRRPMTTWYSLERDADPVGDAIDQRRREPD